MKRPHIVILFCGVGFVGMKRSLIKLMTRDASFSLLDFHPPTSEIVDQIKQIQPDGLLIQSWDKYIDPILELSIPTAIVNATREHAGCINVGIDNVLVGQSVAQYFIDSGFSEFAFLGLDTDYTIERKAAYTETLKTFGIHKIHSYLLSEQRSYGDHLENQNADLGNWLQELPKPVSVFSVSDPVGRTLCATARKNQLLIPDDISVVGVMDDLVFCELSDPPLSSLRYPWLKMCDLAGDLLLDKLNGRAVSEKLIKVAPNAIHVRQSSEVYAVEDATTRQALNWLRSNAHQNVNIDQMCHTLGLNRRTIEKSFRNYLQISPREELERIRVQRVKHLLTNTDMQMPLIAERCGFNDAIRMTASFKRVEGVPPAVYRRNHS